ncbi:hypothetical protein ES705_12667 [subsurface metagenome]
MVNGTYNFSSKRNAFTFVFGVVGANVDASGDVDNLTEIVGGTIEVKVEGTTTQIDFQLITKTNATVPGNFKGVLTLM